MHESPKIVLERLLVLLLARENIALYKFWTLETLEVLENSLLPVIPSMNYTWA
jgi:hypothetical protein